MNRRKDSFTADQVSHALDVLKPRLGWQAAIEYMRAWDVPGHVIARVMLTRNCRADGVPMLDIPAFLGKYSEAAA